MIQNQILRRVPALPRFKLSTIRSSSSANIDLEKLEAESTTAIEVIDDEIVKREAEIERKRNKSRLRTSDRNILFDKKPFEDIQYAYQGTVKYNRRLFGRYGFESGVNPSICWPTKQELADVKEYEQVAFPRTVLEMAEIERTKRQEKEERILKRQKEIVERVGKLDGWVKDMKERIAKKEKEANAAKAHRERLIEEVRAHFGYTVDPRDDKFKEMLEKKEKEQKKAQKEERRKLKQQQLMDKLLKKPVIAKSEAVEGQKET